MNEFNFNSYGNSKQSISYCEVDKCPAVIKLREQLEAYKMEAEEGKEINGELKEKLQNTTISLYSYIGDFDKLTKEHVYLKNKYRKEIDKQRKSIERYKQAVSEIRKYFVEDKKFARYSGYPIVFCRNIVEKIVEIQQENKKLKQYKASKQARYESMQREWHEAMNENRELKVEIETLKSFDINLVGIKECEKRQLVQYRKTLTEIKEIAENNKRAVLCFTAFEGDYIEVNNEPMTAILQKISEALDEKV